jgi:Lrp/AsnC family leucine-responsive transcriptional regulator
MRGSCRESVAFKNAVQAIPNVLQCHHVLGEECFYLQVAVESMCHLEKLIESLYQYAETETTMILTSPVEHRILGIDVYDEGR